MRRCSLALAGVVLVSSTALGSGVAAAIPTAGPVAAEPFDVNGDGTPELVVGADHLQVGSVKKAGGVVVLSSLSKDRPEHAQVVTQATRGVPGSPRRGYRFGAAVASADFNGDGYADLAVGSPADDVGGDEEEAGSVTVLFGSPAGLTGNGAYVLHRAGPGTDDGFGAALAAADFDGDGRPDLAVGAPDIDQSDTPGADEDAAGSVTVFAGTGGHFSAARSRVLTGVLAGPRLDDDFGSALAVGDVDAVPGTDLVVGSRGSSSVYDDRGPGSVTVCSRAVSCTQISSQADLADLTALAVGNVSGSTRPEIAVGVVPSRDAKVVTGGSVFTLSLSGRGTATTATTTELTQSSAGVPGKDEKNDAFGAALTVGDLEEDGYDDLVVGSPGEAVKHRAGAGQVTVVHGGKHGYRQQGNRVIGQDSRRVPGVAEKGDQFGAAVLLSDRNGDGHLDLAVGAPGENNSGAVTTLDGSNHDLVVEHARAFGLKSVGQYHRHGAELGDVLGG